MSLRQAVLVAAGASADSPLDCASTPSAALMLVMFGADPSARLGTALERAVSRNRGGVVAILLQAGAVYGGTRPLLSIAAAGGFTAVVSTLLLYDADPNGRLQITDATPLMLAAQRHDEATLMALLDAEAAVDLVDIEGNTALHFASRTSAVGSPAVDLLLCHGASPRAANRAGATPVVEAAAAGCLPAVMRLVQAGGQPTAVARAWAAPYPHLREYLRRCSPPDGPSAR